tara:strand:- start:18 stop:260 length:243 start_codon:yes stop_codon:yes gene_type:complete
MPDATPALMDLVEPYWEIEQTIEHALCVFDERPGPSWPKTRTHSFGKETLSKGTDPGRLSTPISGILFESAQISKSSIFG